jgi:hypothetical protein
MKLLIAEAVDPLSFFAFSTALSTAKLATCFVFSGIESEDFAISVTCPMLPGRVEDRYKMEEWDEGQASESDRTSTGVLSSGSDFILFYFGGWFGSAESELGFIGRVVSGLTSRELSDPGRRFSSEAQNT